MVRGVNIQNEFFFTVPKLDGNIMEFGFTNDTFEGYREGHVA
jgi:hypothetical protein